MLHDIHGNITPVVLDQGPRTATGNSTGVDLSSYGFVGRGSVLLSVGNVSGTTPTLDAKLQESPDNTTWTDVASFTQVTATDAVPRVAVDFRSATFRYLRIAYTLAGTSPVYEASATLIGMQQSMQ